MHAQLFYPVMSPTIQYPTIHDMFLLARVCLVVSTAPASLPLPHLEHDSQTIPAARFGRSLHVCTGCHGSASVGAKGMDVLFRLSL